MKLSCGGSAAPFNGVSCPARNLVSSASAASPGREQKKSEDVIHAAVESGAELARLEGYQQGSADRKLGAIN